MTQNTASRLFDILSRAKSHASQSQTLNVWAKTFGVEPALEEVAPLLVELMSQLDSLEGEVRTKYSEQKADTSLELFPKIRKALAFHQIHTIWSDTRNLLSDDALYSLKILIHDMDVEPDLTSADLEEVNNALNELFELVNTSTLNRKLREWIMNWLSLIRRAIDRYKISGPRGLQDALVRIQGEAQFFWPAFEKVKGETPTVYSKLSTLFEKLCKVSDITDRCRKLCESPLTGYVGSFILRRLGVEVPPSDGTPS